MLKVIMVPLDTSALAEQALPHALMLARHAHARLHLVCVRAPFPLAAGLEPEEDRYLARIASQVESELPNAVSHTVLTDERGPLYPPVTSFGIGHVLAQHTLEHDVDMIVMATHGRGGVGRAWLGSVADSFLRIAPRPVLLIRARDETFASAIRADRGISHIVIPLDGSDTAEQVIPYALELGSGFDARYSLIRVLLPQDASPYVMLPGSPAPPDLADYLERLATPLRAQGLTVTARVVDDRSPAHGILQYVATHGGDAITLATAGAGCIGRMLLGSVTDKIVRTSDVPVLVCNIRRLEPAGEESELIAAAAAPPTAG